MAAFGQSLPALPQIYTNQALFQFSKMGLASHLARALVTVGMEPQIAMWPTDILSDTEAVLPDNNNNNSTHIFAFTFPDTSTFSINNENWRPFIAIVVYLGELTNTNNTGRNKDYLRIDSGIMREGAVSLADTRGRYRQFTGSFFGWGLQNDVVSNAGTGGIGDLSRGLHIFKSDWLPYASYAGTGDVERLSVQNIFVYLGGAGLFVYMGTGSTRSTFGNVLAAGFVFGSDRLPDRANPVDPNINRINPVLTLPLSETNGNVWNGARLRVPIQAIQHDLLGYLDWVWGDIWNLESSEVPFYPDRRPYTIPSPRQLSSGAGAHILGRIVTIPKTQFNNGAILYGPVNPRISSSDTRPLFSEVFAAPRCRFCDLTAPLGDYEDPDTLENWRIVPYPATGGTIGLYSENAQITSVLSFGARTLLETRTYDFTAKDGNFPLLNQTPEAYPSTPAGATVTLVHLSEPGGNNGYWASSAATNDIVHDMTPWTNSGNITVELEFTIPSTDPLDSVYEIEFEMRIRGGNEGNNQLNVYQVVTNSQVGVTLTQGANVYPTTVTTAGSNTSSPIYDFNTYVVPVVRDSAQTSAPIRFRLNAQRDESPDDTVIEIRDIRLKRYRYL